MKAVRLGIIGAGRIANNIHLPVLSRMENAALSAICDLRPDRAQNTADKFGIPGVYGSHVKLLAAARDLDAVFVLTEPDALFRASADSLKAGLPVFMEKPMGVTAYQARTLNELAKKQNCLLHVGYNRRYIPLVIETVRLMSGWTEITQVEGRFYKNSSAAFYGGCVSAFACDVVHVIDLVRHLSGSRVANAATLETAGQSWHCIMRFENGVSGVVRSNYSTGGRVHDFEIHGPLCSAYINLGFGDSACTAKIIKAYGVGKQSISAMGSGKTEIIELDGARLSGSERYEDYYGYRDEDALFINGVSGGAAYDTVRTAEDAATSELVETLLNARI